jgi:hypothetical protein
MYLSSQPVNRGTYLMGAPLSRRRLRLGYLAAITADQAAETVFPAASVSKHAGETSATRALLVSAATDGQLINAGGAAAYIPGTSECSATGQSTNVKLAQVSGTMAITGINVAAALSTRVGAAIGAALGPLTLGLSTLVGLLPLLFGHHAQKVKKEQSMLCAAVPAANNYLQIIDQAVSSGQVTPAQGIAALNSLQSDFRSQVSSIIKGDSPTASQCNAACVMYSQLKAIVAFKVSQYQDLQTSSATAGGAVSSVTSAISSAVASTGLPPWVLYAAGGLLLYELL